MLVFVAKADLWRAAMRVVTAAGAIGGISWMLYHAHDRPLRALLTKTVGTQSAFKAPGWPRALPAISASLHSRALPVEGGERVQREA